MLVSASRHLLHADMKTLTCVCGSAPLLIASPMCLHYMHNMPKWGEHITEHAVKYQQASMNITMGPKTGV